MAIGLYDKALSQPTVVPNWYKAPTELIAKAIEKRQLHYDLNRKGLDELGIELDKADGIEGIDKETMIKLRQEYAQLEDDIINKTDGDLSKADDYIRAYGERISKDFSSTGAAGTIKASKEAFDNLVSTVNEMRKAGKYTDADAWWMINRAKEEYNARGGHRADYDKIGQYTSFNPITVSEKRNISDEALKIADKWMANKKYRPLSEMNYDKYIDSYKTNEGYVIYVTADGAEYVDREEVANALITNFMSDTGIREQLYREYQYQKYNGSLNPLYNKSYEDILNERKAEMSSLSTKRNELVSFLASNPTRTELNNKYKELTGYDVSNANYSDATIIQAIESYIAELKKIEDYQRVNIEQFSNEYGSGSRSIEHYNFHAFMQDNVEEQIALAAEKAGFTKEFSERSVHADLEKARLNQLELENIKARRKAAEYARKNSSSNSNTSKPELSTLSEATFGYETTNKIQEEYIKTVKESAKEHAIILSDNVRKILLSTQGIDDAEKEKITNFFANDTELLKYLDEEGDFNFNKYVKDYNVPYGAVKELKKNLAFIHEQTRKLKQSKIEATRLIENEKEKVWQASGMLDKDDRILVRGSYANTKDFYSKYPYGETEGKAVINLYKNLKHIHTNFPDYIIAFNNLVKTSIEWNKTKDEKNKAVLEKKITSQINDLGLDYILNVSLIYDMYGKPREEYVAANNNVIKRENTGSGSYNSRADLTDFEEKTNNYFLNLKNVKRTLNDKIDNVIESYDDDVEYKMIFNDIPQAKTAIAKYNETHLLNATISNLKDKKGLKDGMTVQEALINEGLESQYSIISVKVSEDTYMGEQMFELTYAGNNSEGRRQYATLYLPRQTSLEVLDENKNAIIPTVSEVNSNISNAKRNIVKTGNAGSSYIMDINNNRFYYFKRDKNAEPQIKIKYADGDESIVSYNIGVMAMLKSKEKATIIDKLTDYSIEDNLSKPFTKSSTFSKADVISTFLTFYVDEAVKGTNLSNNLQNMIGKVLVVPIANKSVKDLDKLEPTLISLTELNRNPDKYIKIKEFGEADINLINNIFSQTKSKIPNLD